MIIVTSMTFDVRDLVSGAARGSRFEVVRLGTSGNDAIDDSASARPTYINAGMGDDEVTGGTRSDFLVGGGGDDRLSGGRGSDSLLGGLGGDTFAFSGSSGADRILDFASGTDRIDLSAYGIDIGDVETSASGANTLIDVDSDSDGAFDFQILNFQQMYYSNPTILQYNMLESAFDPVYGKRTVDYDLAYVSYYVENGDYWKLDNATLGFTIPNRLLGLPRLPPQHRQIQTLHHLPTHLHLHAPVSIRPARHVRRCRSASRLMISAGALGTIWRTSTAACTCSARA